MDVQDGLKSTACRLNGTTSTIALQVDHDIEYLKEILVVLHYANLAPYLCIFIYSFLYEITYSGPNSASSVDDTPKKFRELVTFFKHIMSYIVGLLFACAMTAFVLQKLFHHQLFSILPNETCQEDLLRRSN